MLKRWDAMLSEHPAGFVDRMFLFGSQLHLQVAFTRTRVEQSLLPGSFFFFFFFLRRTGTGRGEAN